MGQDKKAAPSANRAAPVVSGQAAEFFEASAKCAQQCADGIAANLPRVPDEEKPTHKRAIGRNWVTCLKLKWKPWMVA